MSVTDTNLAKCKERTLVLVQTDPGRDVVFNVWKQSGINASVIFKPQPKIVRLIRRLWANYFIPGYSFWYGDWKRKLDNFDTVIVHADIRTRTVPGYIHKIKQSMRVIYWYWNPVNNESLPELTRDKNIECWSFDDNDCNNYKMKKNVQYYYEQCHSDSFNTEYDLYFVGRDKGRKEIINNIKTQLEKLGIKCKFDIFNDSDTGIQYEEVQRRIKKSKAILEVNQHGQVGCTLRALESLFFRKKLITTNANIIHEDFYNPENIFVWNLDNIKNLNSFLNTPYDSKSDIYRDSHTVDAWFSNFFKGKEN